VQDDQEPAGACCPLCFGHAGGNGHGA
jgi:hypothetical protein